MESDETPGKYAHLQYTGPMPDYDDPTWRDNNPQQAWAWSLVFEHLYKMFPEGLPSESKRGIENVLETLDWLKARSDQLTRLETEAQTKIPNATN